jgi:DNA-binding MarR family transcriptional regulator
VTETVLLVMRTLRAELRRSAAIALSEQQVRALAYLRRHAEDSVSALAEYLGLGLPTASKLVDGLVRGGYVERQRAAQDRRRARLALTAAGRQAVEAVLGHMQARLGEDLQALPAEDLATVGAAMGVLRRIYGDSES